MEKHRLARMLEALHLTRRGRVAEATALLQAPDGVGLPQVAPLSELQTVLPELQTVLPDPQTLLSGLAPGPVAPGRFVELSYANAAGERAYKLYVPTSYA